MKNSLFLGNGIFRLRTEEEKSIGCEGRDKGWGDLLSEIALGVRTSFNCSNPMPVEYDRIVAAAKRSSDDLKKHYSAEGRSDKWRQVLNEDSLELGLKRYIADWFNERSFCAPRILDSAIRLKLDHILTSNYDLRIENSFSREQGDSSDNCARIHDAGSKALPVWHVHGSIEEFSSIVIGQSDYLKSAAAINRCLTSWDKKSLCKNKQEWPLLFLTTNIFILGFGFGLEEIDLWHLLHLRSSLFSQHPEIDRNLIRYYNLYPSGGESLMTSDPVRYNLLTDYEVQVIGVPVVNGDYEDGYRTALDLIADEIFDGRNSESNREAPSCSTPS